MWTTYWHLKGTPALGNIIVKNIFLLNPEIVGQILLRYYRRLHYDNDRISMELDPMVERLVSVSGCGNPTFIWRRDWKFLFYIGTLLTLIMITAFLFHSKSSG